MSEFKNYLSEAGKFQNTWSKSKKSLNKEIDKTLKALEKDDNVNNNDYEMAEKGWKEIQTGFAKILSVLGEFKI